jgi:hypothetical protein
MLGNVAGQTAIAASGARGKIGNTACHTFCTSDSGSSDPTHPLEAPKLGTIDRATS